MSKENEVKDKPDSNEVETIFEARDNLIFAEIFIPVGKKYLFAVFDGENVKPKETKSLKEKPKEWLSAHKD